LLLIIVVEKGLAVNEDTSPEDITVAGTEETYATEKIYTRGVIKYFE